MIEKIVIASTREEAGKTSLIIGLAKALEGKKKIGYMKPLGDRLLYQKKRLWDYDSALVSTVLNLDENPEDISIGFNHSKLRFMYDESTTKEKLNDIVEKVSRNKDLVLIEGSKSLSFGYSVYLDPLSIIKTTGAKLILVIGGTADEAIIDDIAFIKNCILTKDVDLLGVVITQIKDTDDFKSTYMDTFKELGVNVLGVLPYKEELSHFSMEYLTQTIFGKVLAGEKGLHNVVKHIFVGAMSAANVVNRALWKLENKLIITPGDRRDMILAALESNTAGIVLTNNILPDDPILMSKANINNIPLILVSADTFATAKTIDDMEILFTKDETEKIKILETLVKENIELSIF
ncbi:MAG: AAA family ATPase [Candidatus Hodarchaeales archaeon]|jgi:BioD-like phosphotransacetylase family protein